MHYDYIPSGICATKIEFDIEEGKVKNVKYTGGCNGNLKAIGALVEGKSKEKIIELLKGITCGHKNTSCSDQLAKALASIEE